MSTTAKKLYALLVDIAASIEREEEPNPELYTLFIEYPEFAFQLIKFTHNMEEIPGESMDSSLYAASLFALDVCIAQLQAASEAHNITIANSLNQLMNELAQLINTQKHSLRYWLPVLNAFYAAHVELTEPLKDAYFDLAKNEEQSMDSKTEPMEYESIRDIILELSDLSVFDMAEHFFAQSYAMPAEFFFDLMVDLYNIEEGHDLALLLLLHPKAEVREVAVATFDQIIDQVILSSQSLSRLHTIKYWYGNDYFTMFDKWIKIQRKKGVVFAQDTPPSKLKITVTEVDGSGSQGIFIQVSKNRKTRLCGLLINSTVGIKDAWVTPVIPAASLREYYNNAFTENVTLRQVEIEYLELIIPHFLDITIKNGALPYLYFLELHELLGLRLRPHPLNMDELFEQMSVQIVPFTEDVIQKSLKRSKSWMHSKAFTESWYVENSTIDKIVNHNSNFVGGVKICRLSDAMNEIFTSELELHRNQWEFHFLWMALWAKSKARSNEKIWEDNFLIAYLIRDGMPLKDIPVMQEICHQTVINSIETMSERRTHLSKE